jgi:hypothetical protein
MRPDFRGFLAWVLSAHDARGWRQVALQTKSEKYCAQTPQSFVALQSRPVKDPAFAFSHDQDPFRS